MVRRFLWILALVTLLPLMPAAAFSQDIQSIRAMRFSTPPSIDGDANDDAWKDADSGSGFIQFEPHNGDPASVETFVKVGFD